ncbi:MULTISPECIES: hypothetical protein [Empedobacter]|uniref:hypothetical protein n=1 Tax=Empedobacter TaxID=59734 RepID=UPI002575CF3A|nr:MULTISPECIES: hypothetical protein [Empedobacter]MDM1042148.1 hypothetical protein [Empedobacter brevis]MDM1135978.1 hypothetical protein [Empedobacter sp. R750]
MIKKITFFLFVALLVSCSNPLDKKYSETTLEQDAKAIKESKKLSDEDLQLLAGWIVKAKLTGESLESKTYDDILNEAKNYKLEQEKLKIEAEKAEAEKAKKMTDAITVSITGKGFIEADFQSYNTYKYAIKNKSSKTIDAVKFNFTILNKLGDEIGDGYELSLTDDKIAPNQVYINEAFFDYNQFMDQDIKIKNSKFEDLKFVIKVVKIVYTDGTTLE